MFKVGDKVKYKDYPEQYFGEIFEINNNGKIIIRDYTFKAVGFDGFDILKNIPFKQWQVDDDRNLIYQELNKVIEQKKEEIQHIAGITPETIDQDAFREFMRSL